MNIAESEIFAVMPESKPATTLVKYENVRKTFGDTEVLKGLNLEIKNGEKLALIGPSGSGKTTIIRMLMTLEKPSAGYIKLGNDYLWHKLGKNGKLTDSDEKHLRKMRQNVGMVFQHFNLFPYDRLTECYRGTDPCFGMSKDEAENRAVEMLTKVGLREHFINIRNNFQADKNNGCYCPGSCHATENHVVR